MREFARHEQGIQSAVGPDHSRQYFIVVERAASLRYEERQEAPFPQESELAGIAHDFLNPATLVTHTFRCPVLVYLTTTNQNVVSAARGREGNRNGNEAVH